MYGKMTSLPRDPYRHVVEKIAKSGQLSEVEVAPKRYGLAHKSACRLTIATNDRTDRGDPCGLLPGRPMDCRKLEELAQVRLSVSGALRKGGSRFPVLLYLGTIIANDNGFHRWVAGEGT